MDYKFPVISPTSYIGRAYSIIDELNAGKTTDDNAYSVRLIIASIKTEYSHVLRQDFLDRCKRGETPSEQAYQEFTVNVAPTESCGVVCNGTVKVKRAKIGKIAEYCGDMIIRDVRAGMVDVIRAENLSDAKQRVKPSEFVPLRPVYYVTKNYIYLLLPARMQGISCISYSAVLEDASVEGACLDVWAEFNMVDYLWSEVKARVKQLDGNMLLTTAPKFDKVNNGSPENQTA